MNRIEIPIIPGKNQTEKKPLMYQAFRWAAQHFKLIDDGSTGIIVPYKNQELLDKLKDALDDKDYVNIKILLQKLQKYCINIRFKRRIITIYTKI